MNNSSAWHTPSLDLDATTKESIITNACISTLHFISPANPGKHSVFPEPVKPEAQSKEFEKKLKRRKSEAIVEREGSLVGVVVKVNGCLGIS